MIKETPQQPSAGTFAGDGDNVTILVRFQFPSDEVLGLDISSWYMPGNNRIGTLLMASYLELFLKQRGVRVLSVHGTKPLDRALFFITVSELHPALQYVKVGLEQICEPLYKTATIGWIDLEACVFRSWYPKEADTFPMGNPGETMLETSLYEQMERLYRGKIRRSVTAGGSEEKPA